MSLRAYIRACITLWDFKSHHKMSPIKVPWYVLRVKNMHFGSTSDSWDPCSKAKPSFVQYIIRQGEAELRMLELTPRMYPRSRYFLLYIIVKENFNRKSSVPLNVDVECIFHCYSLCTYLFHSGLDIM